MAGLGDANLIKPVKNGGSLKQLVGRWPLCTPFAAPAASCCLNARLVDRLNRIVVWLDGEQSREEE